MRSGGPLLERHSHRHHRLHSRSGSVCSRSSSRSSASSLSVDEMLLQATAGGDDPDRRVAGNGPNGAVPGSVPSLPPAALRQHASQHRHRPQSSGTQSDLAYPQPSSRLRPDSPLSDYRPHRPRNAPHNHSPPQPTIMTGPGMNAEAGVGPLPQPGQVQTYQTHVFAPVVTGAPVKKSKFMGSSNAGAVPLIPPELILRPSTSTVATGVAGMLFFWNVLFSSLSF